MVTKRLLRKVSFLATCLLHSNMYMDGGICPWMLYMGGGICPWMHHFTGLLTIPVNKPVKNQSKKLCEMTNDKIPPPIFSKLQN